MSTCYSLHILLSPFKPGCRNRKSLLLMLLSLLSDFLEFNERFSKMNSTSICEAVTDAIPCLRRRFYRHLNFVATTLLRCWFGPLNYRTKTTILDLPESLTRSSTLLAMPHLQPRRCCQNNQIAWRRAIGIGDICSVQGQRCEYLVSRSYGDTAADASCRKLP